MNNLWRLFGLWGLLLMMSIDAKAQVKASPIEMARTFMAENKPDSALPYYKYAYEQAPFDVKIYQEYLGVLKDLKKYDDAISLTDYMTGVRRQDPVILLDKAEILKLQNKPKPAAKITDSLLKNLPNSTYELQRLVNALTDRKLYDEVLQVYHQYMDDMGNEMAYGEERANIYLLKGDWEKALRLYAVMSLYQQQLDSKLKATLLQKLETEPNTKAVLQKTLNKLIKTDADNIDYYTGLLTWMSQLDGNYMSAVDALLGSKSNDLEYYRSIYNLGYAAMKEREYEAANKAFASIVKKGKGEDYYKMAYGSLLQSKYYQLYNSRPINTTLAKETVGMMQEYFQEYPEDMQTVTYLWYADVIGKYMGKPESAIAMLEPLVTDARAQKEWSAQGKLTLGDFYLFTGKVWDANLYYAQVDKMFRQDAFGEEARYKQAKLAFYRGDFEWAQDYLNILKASTTELIANDAMDLSILITENTATDTITTPLEMYAKADLMIYQHQFEEAKLILDSIIAQYPEHDILDDIYLLKGNMYAEEGDFANAVKHYQIIIDKYKDGVLADNALLKMAIIYEEKLKDKSTAGKYYEQLILDFPNSTLVASARERYNALNKNNNKP